MNKFLVVYNNEKDPDGSVSQMIQSYLSDHKCECECVSVTHNNVKRETLESLIDGSTDCVIVLGGDGTLIQVAGALVATDIPLLGINLGTLGYLAEVEREQIIPTLDKLMADEYDIEERMMLNAVTHGCSHDALNDIVIARAGELKVVRYNVYVNDKLLTSYDADGIIVSTPTGSTGYNLSAGGPIVEPGASIILMTPICPHTLNSRTVVLSAADKIRIEVCRSKYKREYEAYVSCDGASPVRLKADEYVDIKKASGVTKVIKMSKEGFLEVLSRKLKTTG